MLLERFLGFAGSVLIASIGFIPVFLVMLYGRNGDRYQTDFVLAGLAWSGVWMATAHFERKSTPT
jgi:hypothetical protein